MGLRRLIRQGIIEQLPQKPRLFLERSYYLYLATGHLRDDFAVFKRLCRSGQVALDVGASDGTVALFLCALARHVYCFEPIPTAADELKRKFRGCNVTVESCALGSVDEESELKIPYVGHQRFETRSSLNKGFENEMILGKNITGLERVKVYVKRLDGYHIQNIGFIKIDVEGFELEVLRGGEATIKREKPILFIEIEKRHHQNGDVQPVFRLLKDWGYFSYSVMGKKLRQIEEFDAHWMQRESLEDTPGYINNFVFSPHRLPLEEPPSSA